MNKKMRRLNPILILKRKTSDLSKRDKKLIKFFRNKHGYEYCYNTYNDEHFVYKTRFYYSEDSEVHEILRNKSKEKN